MEKAFFLEGILVKILFAGMWEGSRTWDPCLLEHPNNTGDLTKWDVSRVTTMWCMFCQSTLFFFAFLLGIGYTLVSHLDFAIICLEWISEGVGVMKVNL
jgi:hypothetical protein